MNQILETIDKKNKKKIFSTYSKRFKLIFILSLIIIIITLIFLYNNIWKINQDTEISKILSNNYNTLKLYSNPTSNSSEINTNENFIIGKIEIPKINISYPFFSFTNTEYLAISPCRLSGDMPPKYSNLCIAGHNYDNGMFFSDLSKLKINDKIVIYDNSDYKYTYTIYKIYEVNENDLSPIYDYEDNKNELTLITCNNLNNNRIIVKASI